MLRAEVARLRAENAELRLSPACARCRSASRGQGRRRGEGQGRAKRLTDRYPHSAEAAQEAKRVDALIARERAAQEEAKKIAELGFKALRTSPYFSHGDTSIGLTATAVATRWNFDSHGDGWKYLDAEKRRKFVTATVTVRSKSQDPLLFGIGAYVANGSVLTYVAGCATASSDGGTTGHF